MLKHASVLALAAAWQFACAPASAAQAIQPEGERSAQIERLDVAYVIQPDGSYTETREQTIKVLKSDALEYVKDSSIGYSTSIQKVEVLEAYTLKPDGRRVPVPKSNYQVQTNGGHGEGAPVFSDRTSMTVVFPELAVGDTTVFKYRLTGSQPMFDGQFSEVETFPRETYYGQVDLRFDAPAQLPVKSEAWRMERVRDEVVGDRRLSHWRFQNRQPLLPDQSASAFRFEDQPGLVYSTFAGYGDIALAYGARAKPKAAVTPRIRKLADEIAGTRKEPRDIAKAMYEWVSTQITYAGNCIGLGAVVPHDLDFVLDNRMGDCKDHATLLQALLTAKGIPATQALINSSSLYDLPRTPAVAMVNHVITYLPEWDLYLDATAKGIPFGMLPYPDMGKPVFRVDGYREGTTTPAMVPGSGRQTVKTRLKVGADGRRTGRRRTAGHVRGDHARGVPRLHHGPGHAGREALLPADGAGRDRQRAHGRSGTAGRPLRLPGELQCRPADAGAGCDRADADLPDRSAGDAFRRTGEPGSRRGQTERLRQRLLAGRVRDRVRQARAADRGAAGRRSQGQCVQLPGHLQARRQHAARHARARRPHARPAVRARLQPRLPGLHAEGADEPARAGGLPVTGGRGSVKKSRGRSAAFFSRSSALSAGGLTPPKTCGRGTSATAARPPRSAPARISVPVDGSQWSTRRAA
jgi:transglutaminase-like putative cysteine protease